MTYSTNKHPAKRKQIEQQHYVVVEEGVHSRQTQRVARALSLVEMEIMLPAHPS